MASKARALPRGGGVRRRTMPLELRRRGAQPYA